MLFGKPHQNYILDEIINANLKYSVFTCLTKSDDNFNISSYMPF